MDLTRVELSNNRQVRDFLSLPARIYKDCPQWVPALQGEEKLRLDRRRYPFYRHSEAAFFLAYQAERAVGRLAVLDNRLFNQYNHQETAFFYMFECEKDEEAARGLFEAGCEWARQRGLKKIQGPRGFTALDGLGLLVEGFERRPALGLPYNPDYYANLIEAQGFRQTNDILSGMLWADRKYPERIHSLAEQVMERRGLTIKRLKNRRELREAIGKLKSLYNGALAGTTDGIPITDEEIDTLAEQMLWFADPGLIKIVLKGERPVGFLLAYPDISTGLQKTKGRLLPFGWATLLRELRTTQHLNINGAGMIEEYRGLGGTVILYSELIKSITSNPRYRTAEVVQIGMENERMLREMENFGLEFCKVHRLYEKELG